MAEKRLLRRCPNCSNENITVETRSKYCPFCKKEIPKESEEEGK